MKIRNLSTFFIPLFFLSSAFAQYSTLITGKDWYIPDYAKVQFAWNIGFFSLGFGYQTFNNHLYSELLYGYVPALISKAEQIHTITIKNTLPIFTMKFNTIALSPFTGFTASFETGNNSFIKLPDKYPKDYYSTNAFYFTFLIGASIHKDFINSNIINGADFYFELGTVDTYLWYAIISKEVTVNKILSSAIGISLFF